MTSKPKRKKLQSIRPSEEQKHFINERASMVAMRVEHSDHGMWERGDKWFAIEIPNINPNVVCILPICLLKEDGQRFAAAKGLLIFGNDTNLTDKKVAETWPDTWKYLSKKLRDELWAEGFRFERKRYLMLSYIPMEDIGPYAYSVTNLSTLFDAWLEIIFHEFAVEWELKRFQEEYPLNLVPPKTNNPQFISIFNAKAWIILQNILNRLDAMWECLTRHVLPLYVQGNSLLVSKKNDWRDFDTYVRSKLNARQIVFYDLLRQSHDDYVNHSKTKGDNLLKKLRDTMNHNISPRPDSVFPPTNAAKELPSEIADLYELIKIERSHLYETLIIMHGIVICKTPKNEPLETITRSN